MNTMEIHYIGVCSLLARLSTQDIDSSERVLIGVALADLQTELPGRFEVGRLHKGFYLEPKGTRDAGNIET